MIAIHTRLSSACVANWIRSASDRNSAPSHFPPASISPRTIILGLAYDLRLKSAVAAAAAHATKVGATGSRLLSGNSGEWENLERDFAEFAGTEAALYFGSGYAANVGLLRSVLKPGDIVFSDALNHASLIDGIRLSGAQKIIYPHRDLQFLENALREHANAPGSRLIVTESIFSMEGDVAPLDELLALARKYRRGADAG